MPSSPADRTRVYARIVSLGILAAWAFVSVRCGVVVPRQGWNESWGPMVPHETFPGDCGICHVPVSWDVLQEDFSFDHGKEAGYPLQGAHSSAACLRCHNDRGPVSAYVARGCGGCHVDPHKSKLGLDCARCHDQTSWRPGGLVAEHARTRFPLFGTHSVVPCESCHLQAPVGDFRGAPTACELCHRSDLARATVPDHVTSGLVTDCQRCHTPLAWGSATFNHDSFPLLGGHGGLQCDQCHAGGLLTPVPPLCITCHLSDYQGATDHVTRRYSTDCTRCHSIAAWEP